MTNLFQHGNFVLHSGQKSIFRIDCDALTDEDWETLAQIVAGRYNFGKVIGIPRGGEKFAKALEKYCSSESGGVLIVDDVLTTGASMEEELKRWRQWETSTDIKGVVGVVVFSRGECPLWVRPLFRMLSWAVDL